ncbi:MAG: hypothetical protein MUF01_00825 [Bryobacterales bacterium]|jgi:hypothetical protein|nr:hypothetical protein [Bryobacterales bacterium]
MADWNLALVDVAASWVVVALPRYVQARLLADSGVYGQPELAARAIDERLSLDPVRHTSLLGTLLAPALCSLMNLPVLAWGKPLEAGHPAQPRLAFRLWMATPLVYLAQALLLGLLMALLAKVYLAGAPVAARAAQLCLRMAVVNLLPLPLLESGAALAVLLRRAPFPAWVGAALSCLALSLLVSSTTFRAADQHLALAFFYLSRLFL